MEKPMVKPVQYGKNVRMSYSKIGECIDMPNLIEVQKTHMTGSLQRDWQRYSTI